ncbi:MAG: penicillin-binding protein 1A [Nevskiales bacterium]
MLAWLLGSGGVVLLVSALAVYGLIRYVSSQLPDTAGLGQVPFDVPLRVYSADGKLLGEFGIERRAPLAYAAIPPQLIQAFLASEDDRFFEHPGFDWQGLSRAAVRLVVTGEKTQGGSTITMQLARNLFLTREKTFARKFKEILLALRIERELPKEQILELYLNQIYLGHRAYGAAAAARLYFGKTVEELSLAQMALLAGLPKAPSRDNPITAPERALERRNYVLRRMRELDMIDEPQYEAALAEPLTTRAEIKKELQLEADYVAEMVRAEMVSRYGELAYTSGYRVTTTVQSGRQEAANQALRRGLLAYDQRHGWRAPGNRFAGEDLTDTQALNKFLEELPRAGGLVPAVVLAAQSKALTAYTQKYGAVTLKGEALEWAQSEDKPRRLARAGDIVRLAYTGDEKLPWRLAQVPDAQSALVALDPNTGAIEALVGGFEFSRNKFNRAIQAQRQPGSSFKPFLYSAALDHGFTAASVVNDAPIVFEEAGMEKAWRPVNYTGKFYGPTRLREGLAQSRNLVSVRLLMALGVDRLRDHAAKFALPRERMARNYSIALGTAVFTPLEMARAYAVFANGGFLVEPYLIAEIRDVAGAMVFQAAPRQACVTCAAEEQAPRAISAQNAYIMTSMLQDVIDHGTATTAKRLERTDLAGKTGTTNDFIDSWFAGFNADLVTVTWVGNDQLQSLGEKETGAKAALPIWMDFMAAVLHGTPPALQPQPAGLVAKLINPRNGRVSDSETEGAVYEIFMTARAPTLAAGERLSPAPTVRAETAEVNEEAIQHAVENLF